MEFNLNLTKANWKHLDEYFQCIVECDINDKECTTVCVDQLKENDTIEQEDQPRAH